MKTIPTFYVLILSTALLTACTTTSTTTVVTSTTSSPPADGAPKPVAARRSVGSGEPVPVNPALLQRRAELQGELQAKRIRLAQLNSSGGMNRMVRGDEVRALQREISAAEAELAGVESRIKVGPGF